MRENEILITCAGALDRFGERHQIIKAIEEMGELQQALAKYLNAIDDGSHGADLWRIASHVDEEIADLSLVMKQLRMIFDAQDIRRWEANKADKLRQRTREWRDPKLKKLADELMEAQPDGVREGMRVPPPAEAACRDGECDIREG